MTLDNTARVPVRPLTYENKDLANPKEIVVDYTTGEIYICDKNKNLVNVTADVAKVTEQVIEKINENPEAFVDTVEIELPDGDKVSISESVITSMLAIDDLKELLGYTTDSSGHVHFKSDNLVSTEDRTKWNKKLDGYRLTSTISSNDSKWSQTDANLYVQKINLDGITAADYPVVDIMLSNDLDTIKSELNSYANICKILTYDGYIEVYAMEKSNVDINIQLQFSR